MSTLRRRRTSTSPHAREAERGEHDLSALVAEVAKDTAVEDGERADARRVDGPVADACLEPNILDPAEHERRDFAPALERDHVGTQRLRLPGEDERDVRVGGELPALEARPCLAERLELVQATRHSNARAAPRRDWSLPRHGSPPRAPPTVAERAAGASDRAYRGSRSRQGKRRLAPARVP